MKKIILVIVIFLNCFRIHSQTWDPSIAVPPAPDSEGYIAVAAPGGSFSVWRGNGLIRAGMKIRLNNTRITMQSGNSVYTSDDFPSLNSQDIVPNDFMNVPLTIWATVSNVTSVSATLQIDKVQTITGNRTWSPGTVSLPAPDSEGYIAVAAPGGSFSVWRGNGLIRTGMKIRLNNTRITMQSGNSIYTSDDFPSLNSQDIVPNDFMNVPLTIWATVSNVTSVSATLQIDRVQIIGMSNFWTPR